LALLRHAIVILREFFYGNGQGLSNEQLEVRRMSFLSDVLVQFAYLLLKGEEYHSFLALVRYSFLPTQSLIRLYYESQVGLFN
jgi:hypothetical protein